MTTVSFEDFDRWASDSKGPVALHLEQHLVPVEGEEGVFFPPTYADTKSSYNIDELSDGTKVVLVDSVGSQANRMEPLFLEAQFKHLIPQVFVTYKKANSTEPGEISLLEAGHRLGDAVVRSTELKTEARAAFQALLERNDAVPIARLNPTALVFGAWDSRDTAAKVPRIVQSSVRAWDVDRLSRSAQYKPALDYMDLEVFTEKEREKAEGNNKSPLAQRGFLDNPAPGQHGGVIARGPIRRDVTLNLVALRRLKGEPSELLRQYILGLALVAGVEPMDPFLRQGCLLVPKTDSPGGWVRVERTGQRLPIELTEELVLEYASERAARFEVPSEPRRVAFDKKLAQADVKESEKKKGGGK